MVKLVPKNPRVIFVSRWERNVVRVCKLDQRGRVVSEQRFDNSRTLQQPLNMTLVPAKVVVNIPFTNIDLSAQNDEIQHINYGNDLIQNPNSSHQPAVPLLTMRANHTEANQSSQHSVRIIDL